MHILPLTSPPAQNAFPPALLNITRPMRWSSSASCNHTLTQRDAGKCLVRNTHTGAGSEISETLTDRKRQLVLDPLVSLICMRPGRGREVRIEEGKDRGRQERGKQEGMESGGREEGGRERGMDAGARERERERQE